MATENNMDDRGEIIGSADPLDEFLKSERVTKILAATPISNLMRAQAVLDLANAKGFSMVGWDHLADGVSAPTAEAPETWWETFAAGWRAWLIPALGSLVGNPTAKGRAGLEGIMAQAARSIITIPTITRQGARLSIDHRVVCSGFNGALAFGTALLVSTPIVERLRRCQFSECGNFFLRDEAKKAGGRPRDTYCSKSCHDLGRKEQIRELMRSKRAAAKAKPRRHK